MNTSTGNGPLDLLALRVGPFPQGVAVGFRVRPLRGFRIWPLRGNVSVYGANACTPKAYDSKAQGNALGIKLLAHTR